MLITNRKVNVKFENIKKCNRYRKRCYVKLLGPWFAVDVTVNTVIGILSKKFAD